MRNLSLSLPWNTEKCTRPARLLHEGPRCGISAAARHSSAEHEASESSTGLCSTSASDIATSYLIALGEENWAELRSILMEGSPVLLPTMHRRPLSLGMTPGPGAAAAALALRSPILIRHIPSHVGSFLLVGRLWKCKCRCPPWPFVAINLCSWVSFEACSCFYCKIVVKNFMETNI